MTELDAIRREPSLVMRMQLLYRALKDEIKKAEENPALKTGAFKKDFVKAVIKSMYFKFLNIRAIPDFLESKILDMILDQVIDDVVSLFNRTGVFKNTSQLTDVTGV